MLRVPWLERIRLDGQYPGVFAVFLQANQHSDYATVKPKLHVAG